MSCRREDLQRFLKEKLGRDVSLARFSHVAEKNVFRMVDAQGLTFVKVTRRAYNRRTADFLSEGYGVRLDCHRYAKQSSAELIAEGAIS